MSDMAAAPAKKPELFIKAHARVKSARMQLYARYPFFGVLASGLRIVEPTEEILQHIDTAGVSRRGVMSYNPYFVDSLSDRQLLFLLGHEALHIALRFFDRFATPLFERAEAKLSLPLPVKLMFDLGNRAHDYAINQLLVDDGFEFIGPIVRDGQVVFPGGLLDAKYKGMGAEDIFWKLLEEAEPQFRQAMQQLKEMAQNGGQPQQGAGHGEPQQDGEQSQEGAGNEGDGESNDGQSQQSGGASQQPGQGKPSNGQGGGNPQPGNGQDPGAQGQGGGQSDPSPQQGAGGKGGKHQDPYGMQGDVSEELSDILDKIVWGEDLQGKPNENGTKGNAAPNAQEIESEWKDRMRQAVTEDAARGGKTRGNLPGWMQDEIAGMINPRLTFKQQINQFFGRWGRKILPTFKVRNRKNQFEPMTATYPGKRASSPRVYLLWDVSGSMSSGTGREALKASMGLIARYVTDGDYDVVCYQADVGVNKIVKARELAKSVRENRFEILGNGGSDFVPAFEAIWDDIKMNCPGGAPVIAFTDGMISVPERQRPGIRTETIWVSTRDGNAPTSSWGRHVKMDEMLSPAHTP